MDAAGAQELLLPIIQPLELWQRTGREKAYGPLMFRLTDRKDTGFALAPTAEEVITVTVAGEYGSYRDLPVNLYQFGWKYRDELRPRFGLLRSREFLMKDAYSFDARRRRPEGQLQVDVRRLPPRLRAVRAVVPAGRGPGRRDRRRRQPRVHGRGGGGGGRLRLVPVVRLRRQRRGRGRGRRRPRRTGRAPHAEAMAPEHTPDLPGIKGVAEFLGVEPAEMLKCIAFDVDGEMGLALVPGDREVNPFALDQALPGRKVRLWEDADFDAHPDVPKGYIGPHYPGATVRVADPAVGAAPADGWVTGANRVDHHVRHAMLGPRLRGRHLRRPGDGRHRRRLPPCGAAAVGRPRDRGRPHLPARHEVLGGARRRVHRREGRAAPDGDGLLRHRRVPGGGGGRGGASRRAPGWPGRRRSAPYAVHLVGLPGKGEAAPEVRAAADRLYDDLRAAGVEVLYDDRDQSPGVKFADADLAGHADPARPGGEGSGPGRRRAQGPRAAESVTRWLWRPWSGWSQGADRRRVEPAGSGRVRALLDYIDGSPAERERDVGVSPRFFWSGTPRGRIRRRRCGGGRPGDAVRAAAEPVLSSLGLELVDVEVVGAGRARTLRLTVDRDGGIDLDTLAQANRPVLDALEAVEALSGPYTLEVSSPGLERPLRRPADFRRFVGTIISVKSHDAASPAPAVTGASSPRPTTPASSSRSTASSDRSPTPPSPRPAPCSSGGPPRSRSVRPSGSKRGQERSE